ncbi:hypothetical protein LCGC14_2298620, partial [marine sediment metagenome]
MAKVFVGLPIFNLINSNVKDNQDSFLKNSLHETHFRQVVGASVENARNMLIEMFLKTDCEYFLNLDADIIFLNESSFDPLDRLISLNKDIVGGVYVYKKKPCLPVFRPLNLQKIYEETEKFPDNFFDLIIVDEAHHSAAESWKQVFKKFPNAKVVNMTATPFRSDRAEIEGELVYRYPFKRATLKGYVKHVQAWYVAPSELTFTARGETKTYSLDEVLKLKEKDWFSRGIALSEVCNNSIIDN